MLNVEERPTVDVLAIADVESRGLEPCAPAGPVQAASQVIVTKS